ncbi:MAG: hypothetical protein EP349_04075 [Alphaproteobacteria bacterium]|nr:MAG: hypothetical protein EP349_04075 [Alphaproteobacteria bacterium]
MAGMEQGNLKKRSLIVVAAAAILLNALLPFYATYDSEALAAKLAAKSETQELSALLGEKVLICTGDGFKWVKRADLQNGEEQPAQHPRLKCPLCYLAVFGVKQILPPVIASLDHVPASVNDILQPPGSDLQYASLTYRSYDSRAPPAST